MDVQTQNMRSLAAGQEVWDGMTDTRLDKPEFDYAPHKPNMATLEGIAGFHAEVVRRIAVLSETERKLAAENYGVHINRTTLVSCKLLDKFVNAGAAEIYDAMQYDIARIAQDMLDTNWHYDQCEAEWEVQQKQPDDFEGE